MRSWVIRRLLQLVSTFVGITLITFVLLQLAPGSPVALHDETLSTAFAQKSLSEWRHLKGIDRPVLVQYAYWLWSFVRFDFGSSLVDERPVLDLLGEALPRTLVLTVLSLLLTYAISIPLGIHSAIHRGSRSDQILSGTSFALFSLPSFWIALLLILLVGGGGLLPIFPIRGLQSAGLEDASLLVRGLDLGWHLILPVACLTYPSIAWTSRFQRNAMLDVIGQDFIRTARAKGLSERAVIRRHALRSSLLPVLTLVSADLPWLIGGSLIVERVFTIRGMGMLTFEAILRRDYPVIMGVTALAGVLTLLGVLLADLAYAWADPRIRHART
jgi:peptide/nickel transport system permease protein